LAANKAQPSSPAFENQPEKGQITGFDSTATPQLEEADGGVEDIMKADVAAKAQVMETQRQLLEAAVQT